MLPYDLHIHTNLNGHSDPAQDVPTILSRADSLGLRTIAITEHVMEPGKVRWVHEIARRVARCPSACTVIVGGEIDSDPASADGRLVLEPDASIHLVLGSMHYFPGTRLMPHLRQVPDLPRAEIIRRWRKSLLALASNPSIDIIAHPGAVIVNALPNEDLAADVLEVFAEAAELSARHGIAWEVNRLLGTKLNARQRGHYWKIPKLALEAGVSLVYGSDAHCPGDIASTAFVEDVVDSLGGWACLENPVLPRRSFP